MQPFYNNSQSVFASAGVSDEVNQLFASVAFSSLTQPAAHTVTTWADQGAGVYPLTSNRGATESTNVAIQPNTGQVSGVDKIAFVPNSSPSGLHVDLVSGDLFYNAINITSGGGSGDVVGPSGATDTAVARYDGTTGKLLKNSLATLSDAGALAGVLGIAFQPSLPAGARSSLTWESASGTLSGASVEGPWSTPPSVPWAADRVGNTVTLTLGPAIALNDGVSSPIGFNFGSGFANFLSPGRPQHGTLLVRDSGVDKPVSWEQNGAPGFSVQVSSTYTAPPANSLSSFAAGSTGQTGFPNTVVLSWVIA